MREPLDRGSAKPIFILGMLQRTGTNFLRDLLCLHPDCIASGRVAEDFLTTHSDLLDEYATRVSAHWNPTWGITRNEGKNLLQRYLGEGLIAFIGAESAKSEAQLLSHSAELPSKREKRVVIKTPSVENLHNFFEIFPEGDLIVLVRDGRAVVESAVRSFHRDYEDETRRWVRAARTIVQFERKVQGRGLPYLLVKYEDVWKNREQELRKIFSFLKLDTAGYDFAVAENLAVRGSSTLIDQGVNVHWNAVNKTSSFNPVDRWAKWNRRKHERFNWLADNCLEYFGYEKKSYETNRWFWRLYNVALDTRCFAATCVYNPKTFGRWLLARSRLRSKTPGQATTASAQSRVEYRSNAQ